METVLQILPSRIAELIRVFRNDLQEEMEEVRLRISRPVEVSARGIPHFLPYILS